jgi:glycine/D-amino acid oxidase-like deaminating enzyme
VHTAALPRLVSRVVVAEKAHVKQYPDGRLVLGDDFAPPKTTDHADLKDQMGFPSDAIRALHAQRLVRQAREYLPGVSEALVERLTLGWRPMPADGLPVIGFLDSCPNAYVAVTHSGVTLAAVLGQLVALELLDGVRVERLDPYRPARFA